MPELARVLWVRIISSAPLSIPASQPCLVKRIWLMLVCHTPKTYPGGSMGSLGFYQTTGDYIVI